MKNSKSVERPEIHFNYMMVGDNSRDNDRQNILLVSRR